jgi:predicted dehydrogenase
LKEGFTIDESDDIKVLDFLHSKTFERQGIDRSSGEKFMATTIAEKAISQSFGRLLICRDHSGTPASASLFLFDDKTAFELVSAVDPSETQCDLFKQHYGQPVYPTIASALQSQTASVVVIASLTAQHSTA